MLDVVGEDHLEVATTQHDKPVQALPAYRAHEPLGVGVGPGCPDRCLGNRYALGCEDGAEGGRERCVSTRMKNFAGAARPVSPEQKLWACWVTQGPADGR